MSHKPLDLAKDFVVLTPEQRAHVAQLSPTLYPALDANYNHFKGHQLVSCYLFTRDWPTWERHPAGDEIVVLLNGSARMVIATTNGEESTELTEPGSYVIVPKATWHTAKVAHSATLLFITPGEGTENKAV
jgi:mannose-6-phosphate isomerase-like protein (cupin superfamily)